ncbi:hypothetical protein BDY21DRAFT_349016 [Lineolata rhizophorae]|uniref:Glycosyl transferase CAP10 domain-containing protein n=1 Tax=Lineolata rhizophorae TaxID=578093 RepID=A0A6A6NW12_9PEZI|nr:hypothetical protein BDY21DRAFT_349016 [Lineolata rhizophorae]
MSLLPGTLFVLLEGLAAPSRFGSLDGPPSSAEQRSHASSGLVAILTITATAALYPQYMTSSVTALGLCYALLTAGSLVLLERAITSIKDDKYAGGGGFVSANGSFSRRDSVSQAQDNVSGFCLRDFSGAAALACLLGSFWFEKFYTSKRIVYEPGLRGEVEDDWKYSFFLWALFGLFGIAATVVMNFSMLAMIPSYGAFRLGLVALGAPLLARLSISHSFTQIWFSLVCIATGTLLFHDLTISSPAQQLTFGTRRRMRARHLVILVTIVSLIGLTLTHLRHPFSHSSGGNGKIFPPPRATPEKPLDPLPVGTTSSHPIDILINQNDEQFAQLVERQSKTLEEAVAEYRRRYGMHPPPHFDRWFEFAKRKGVVLVDEFDMIYHSLLPFWALSPATIRARVKEALGFSNNLIALRIRDGQPVKINGGQEWQRKATMGMMKSFVDLLPDMDLAFNIHDEPRVIVPHDQLSRMIEIAKTERLPAALAVSEPKNSFSPNPGDLGRGNRADDVKTTRFNVFAHQQTWTHSRMSCSPNSPARYFDESISDNYTAYALGELGFVYNHTAFSDICNSPSLRHTYGFFERPNAFNIVHDLIPIFSQSKISSFQDILYPSPWYWFGKVEYDESKEYAWEQKNNSLWWRGSTTGGFSRDGGWRRQHRQHIVKMLNALDHAKVLTNKAGTDSSAGDWHVKSVPRQEYADIIDVHFSHVGQCDEGDCDAQKEFFEIVKPSDQQDAWQWKHLLDMDGNAFSGRFYAFLQSKSLVYKMAVFQEWHMEWLRPWTHYVPLSLKGDEWLETVRYFSGEEKGKTQGQRIAQEGREWAGKVLRNEDFEAWFYRLLLEYARVIDDNRETIGYGGP